MQPYFHNFSAIYVSRAYCDRDRQYGKRNAEKQEQTAHHSAENIVLTPSLAVAFNLQTRMETIS